MKLFKGRSNYLRRSRSNTSAKVSKFLGALIFLWDLALIVGTLTDNLSLIDPELKTPAYLFFFALTIMGIAVFQIGFKKDCSPRNPLIYNPGRIAKKRLLELIFGFIFMFCFSSIFLAVDFKQHMFLIPGSIFFIITFIGLYWGIKSIVGLFKKNSKFGKSEIAILTEKISRGNPITIQLINSKVPEHLKSVSYVLRNIVEKWEPRNPNKPRGKKNSVSLKTYIISESENLVELTGDIVKFSIPIPNGATKATDYDLKSPTYWELEIFNKQEKYLSRFYLDVN